MSICIVAGLEGPFTAATDSQWQELRAADLPPALRALVDMQPVEGSVALVEELRAMPRIPVVLNLLDLLEPGDPEEVVYALADPRD